MFKTLKAFAILLSATLVVACGSTRQSASNSKNINGNFASVQQRMASQMNVSPTAITNQKLYLFVDKWLNTKYKYGSQSNNGIDCSGFTQILYQEVYQKKLPRSSQDQYKAINQFKRRRNLSEGDLVFFHTLPGKRISHVGVFLQNNKFISATNSGVLIADLNMEYWDKRYIDGGVVQ